MAEEDEVCIAVLMDVNGAAAWIVNRGVVRLTQ